MEKFEHDLKIKKDIDKDIDSRLELEAAESAYSLIKETILLNPANKNLSREELHKLVMEELNDARNDGE